MVLTIKKGSSKRSISSLLKKLKKEKSSRGIDAYKYCGVIKLNRDALDIQKELRNEW